MGRCDICGKKIYYNKYVKYRKKIYCLECWKKRQTKTVKQNKVTTKQFTEEVDIKELEEE